MLCNIEHRLVRCGGRRLSIAFCYGSFRVWLVGSFFQNPRRGLVDFLTMAFVGCDPLSCSVWVCPRLATGKFTRFVSVGAAGGTGDKQYLLRSKRFRLRADHASSGLSWLSFIVWVGFPARFLFCRPSINRPSSAISSGLLCLPPLWISSSLCINSTKFSMTSSKAGQGW